MPEKSELFIVRGSREYARASLALFCAGFATFALLYCVQPLLPRFTEGFQISSASSSLALSSSTLSLAVGLLLAAALSESWGRKPVMAVALLLACLLGMASALASSWSLLVVLRTFLGLALSGLPALAMAYVGEEFDPRSLPVAMGVYIGGTALGGLLGRLLAAALGDWGGWPLALGSIGGLGLLAWGLFVWLLPPSRHFTAQPLSLAGLAANFARQLANRQLQILFGLSFLLMGSFVALFNYMGFHLGAAPFNLSATWIGFLFLVYLFGIVSANLSGRLVASWGAKPALQIALWVMLAGVLLCLFSHLWLIVAGLALFTIGFFAAHAVASGMVGLRAGAAKAQASALYLCAYYLGSSGVGYTGGWVWQHGGWLVLVLFLAVCLLLALWLTTLLIRD